MLAQVRLVFWVQIPPGPLFMASHLDPNSHLSESRSRKGLIGTTALAIAPRLPGDLAGELRVSRSSPRSGLTILKARKPVAVVSGGGDMDNEEPAVSLSPYVAEMLALETEIEEVLTRMPASLDDWRRATSATTRKPRRPSTELFRTWRSGNSVRPAKSVNANAPLVVSDCAFAPRTAGTRWPTYGAR